MTNIKRSIPKPIYSDPLYNFMNYIEENNFSANQVECVLSNFDNFYNNNRVVLDSYNYCKKKDY